MSLGVAGFRAGHWTGPATGVTVVLAPSGTVGSGEVRGGAPATREMALLEPERTVARVDAVVLAGGSAFGLAAADGVVRFLAERGQGYPTAGGVVPIVPAASIYDLSGSAAPPGPDEGYAAAVAAARGAALATGRYGAGRGASVGKWRGADHRVPGGVGRSGSAVDDARLAVVAVVNALGDVVGDDGRVLAGSTAPAGTPPFPEVDPFGTGPTADARANTTLVVVVTDARLAKTECRLVAHSAHDGFARALRPSHTRFDGDVAVVLASGEVPVHLDRLRAVATEVTAAAIRAAVASDAATRPE